MPSSPSSPPPRRTRWNGRRRERRGRGIGNRALRFCGFVGCWVTVNGRNFVLIHSICLQRLLADLQVLAPHFGVSVSASTASVMVVSHLTFPSSLHGDQGLSISVQLRSGPKGNKPQDEARRDIYKIYRLYTKQVRHVVPRKRKHLDYACCHYLCQIHLVPLQQHV